MFSFDAICFPVNVRRGDRFEDFFETAYGVIRNRKVYGFVDVA